MNVLEIGGGDCRLKIEGANIVHLDVKLIEMTDVLVEWGRDRLPFTGSDMFDLVLASHVIEHVGWKDTHFALTEAHRVLKTGGVIEIWTVDFDYLICCNERGVTDGWLGPEDNPHADPFLWLNARLFSYSKSGRGDDPNLHRSCFNESYLRRCLIRAGFTDIKRLEKTRTREHGPVNMGLSGVKL